jgi:hypothetical protein
MLAKLLATGWVACVGKFYKKSVLVIDGRNINEPNLERAEDEKAQKR